MHSQRKLVVVFSNDTDMLVMFIPRQIWKSMCCAVEIICIVELQSSVSDMKQHFICLHAIGGCGTVSAPHEMRNESARSAAQLW